jgi:hypothetical protein
MCKNAFNNIRKRKLLFPHLSNFSSHASNNERGDVILTHFYIKVWKKYNMP